MRAPIRIIPLLTLPAALLADAGPRASTAPTSLYNLAGFAAAAATGGGELPDTDPAYRRAATPLEFAAAIRDANAGSPEVRVIEIIADLDFGLLGAATEVRALFSDPPRAGAAILDIKPARPGLTLFSANGATLRRVNLNIKDASNIIIRNLRFEEPWKSDEAAAHWNFITLGDGGPASDIWIDHCTFTKSGGGIDMKAGSRNVTVSWCRYYGINGTHGPGEPASADANTAATPSAITATFHHLLIEDAWDTAVPRLRDGNLHCYNLYAGNTRALAASRLRDEGAAPGGAALLIEKSVCIDCPRSLFEHPPVPSAGKFLAIDVICHTRNADGTITTIRGNNAGTASPDVPFFWNLPGGALPYSYAADDPTVLSAILDAGAGAGVVSWGKENWLKTAYAMPPADSPPTIIVQPAAQTARAGGSALFTVAAGGSPALAYQWYKDNAPLRGETTSMLALVNIGARHAANYHVVVSNDIDTVTSNAVPLTIEAAATAVAPLDYTPQALSPRE